MNACLIVCVGIPASGKSTWASQQASSQGSTIVVSRDAIRLTMFGKVFDPAIEPEVSKIQDALILQGLRDGKTVIVDNTNVRGKYRNDLKKLCQQSGVDVTYEEKPFLTDIEVCRARNNARAGNKVPVEAFNKFVALAMPWYSGKIKPETIEFRTKAAGNAPAYDNKLDDCIICDLDGTLCNLNGRDPYDPSTCAKDLVVQPILDCLNAMYMAGKKIIFVSGRTDTYKHQTVSFLLQHVTFPYKLYMRKADDSREDSLVKKDIYKTYIASKYNVSFVIDDRPRVVRMWRYDLGLMVFQVNDREF